MRWDIVNERVRTMLALKIEVGERLEEREGRYIEGW